ncbi:hypothetical protein R1flu_006888 [Riccia fluitans]|uniref:SHSP domain-containing protein n=1 Tax=Riccia fluitans TaxID=41844 RepID=A0ABD1Z002_9MARC
MSLRDMAFLRLMNLPDEMENYSNAPAHMYVQDSKAMARTVVDIEEFPEFYVFVADMPGLKSSDVKVQLENDNILSISGERKRKEPEGGKYIQMERKIGRFMRKFVLPSDADLEKIAAACQDGVLTVTVPKVPPPEPPKPKTIEVR